MCGFFGVFNFRNNPIIHKDKVLFGLNEIKYRGPDATNTIKGDFFLIGHNRLRIIDLSITSDQPFYSYCRNYAIIFNGEIYNHKDLSNKYLLHKKLRTNSDTEILLELLIRFKEKILNEIIGMFSFVFIDIRNKEILISRDNYGIKPFYYYADNDENLWVSSEPKCFKILGSSRTRNIERYINYSLGVVMDEKENTFFSKIKQLPPGHFCKYRGSKIIFEKYSSRMKSIYDPKMSFQDYTKLLSKSIKRHLISDVNICLFFSGGIDSSILVPFIKDIIKKPNLITAILDENTNLGKNYINSLLDKYHLKTEFINCNYLQSQLPSLYEMLDIFDEPFNPGENSYKDYHLFKYANQKNYKVVLEGQGADELFWGYGRYTSLLIENLILKGDFTNLNKLFSESQLNKKSLIYSFLYKYFKRINSYNKRNYLLRYRFEKQKEIIENFNLNLNFDCNMDPRLKNLYQFRQFDIDSKLQRVLRFKDRISMQNSIELRTPYLDQELFESFKLTSLSHVFNNYSQKSYSKKLFQDQYQNIKILKKNSFLKSSSKKKSLTNYFEKELIQELEYSAFKMFKEFFGKNEMNNIMKVFNLHNRIYARSLVASAHYFLE